MLQKTANYIDKNLSFLKEKKLLVAISGGVDSVVLTHLMHSLKYDISLAHCNFKLRGNESDLDENFILKLGKQLNLKTFTTQFNTNEYAKKNKVSIQVAARELRYNWFNTLCENHQLDYVLTAHHADDNLETFLINLSRGTGLEGLTGIPVKNANIIRPLLTFSREQIKEYALKKELNWREDASNSETKYLRNKLRHEVIPTLKEINPQLLNAHIKTTHFLKQSQEIVNDKIKEVSAKTLTKQGDLLKISIPELLKLSNPKAYLYQLLKAYKFTEWNDVYNLIYAQSGKQVSTNFYSLLKDRDFLLLLRTDKKKSFNQEHFIINRENTRITKPINLLFENVHKQTNIDVNNIFVDKDLLTFPLTIRKWKVGDFFYPTGMNGKKKLSKYFKDEKISIFEKKEIWLLCTNKDEIVWIIGKRQDRRFIPKDRTTNFLKVKLKNNPS